MSQKTCRPQRRTKTLKYWTVVTIAELSIHFLFKMMPSPGSFPPEQPHQEWYEQSSWSQTLFGPLLLAQNPTVGELWFPGWHAQEGTPRVTSLLILSIGVATFPVLALALWILHLALTGAGEGAGEPDSLCVSHVVFVKLSIALLASCLFTQ